MKNDDGLPFDRLRWRHESGPESLGEQCGTEPDDSHLVDPETMPGRGTSKTEEKRLRDLKARAGQGDRIDYRQHIRETLPAGYKLTPDAVLLHAKKVGRTNSLKAAAERRTRRRDQAGIILYYDRHAWDKLKQATHEATPILRMRNLAAITDRRWDPDRDLYWSLIGGGGVEHLYVQFRSASPRSSPKKTSREYMRERGWRLEGWFTS